MDVLNLSNLLGLIEDTPALKRLAEKLASYTVRATVVNAARPCFIAALHRRLKRPVIVITGQAENSRKLYDQLCVWSGSEMVKLLPEPDALPYERVVTDSLTEIDTLRTLATLCGKPGDDAIVVVSAHALAMKQPDARDFAAAFHTIKVGDAIAPEVLMKKWLAIGYQVESVVEVPGTMGRRGGIIDIYPPTSDLPARLEFFGNYIESIRFYNPVDQLSKHQIESLTVSPAAELLPLFSGATLESTLRRLDFSACSEETRARFVQELEAVFDGRRLPGKDFYAPLFNQDSLLSYLPENTLLVLDEPLVIQRSLEDLETKARELREGLLAQGGLPVNFPVPFFTWRDLQPVLEKKPGLALSSFGIDDGQIIKPGFASLPGYAGQVPAFINQVKGLIAEKKRIIIVSHQASRLQELLAEKDIIAVPQKDVKIIPTPSSLTLLQGLLAEGWRLDDSTFLYTDAEIFGFTKVQRFQKKRPLARHKLFADIKPGDYVVHIEHGIGEFIGFTVKTPAGGEREYLVIKYAGGDNLYVPTDQVDRVSRYVGAGEEKPSLSRLGTQEWARTKQKVQEATEEVAKDLLDLYASRELVKGHTYGRDTIWQRELEASFPYVETPDQVAVLEQVKEDMEKSKPMDRLVCGDVGYGKTEVALRAAFKAVMDGKQVAVLVPTTVLAQQHLATFTERMKAFPIRIEVLSRFRTPRQQKEVIGALEAGSVDICIGTHRIIQKDVKFKDLGLLIIDEEQRFGVQHKEFLKKMRQEVDVLTLSATPIPRTLHMSLVGVRDMSTMETPPEDRLPIKTYIAEYEEQLIREAILREIERNGQVFFVHNRVQSIEMMANRLRRLVPEARITVGHGQMAEELLEKVTTDFIHGKYDILVCTTIIESGLDMPNVNTLIVNQADRFGLTQLYQLRGRVGRGVTLAYAYFLFDRGKRITPVAEKRLRTIHEATELGAGFNIAIRDLEIRGAGTLLGVRQSGHISAVGFHLYSQMLTAAVENLKMQRQYPPGEEKIPRPQEKKMPPPGIDLALKARIPEDYVEDIISRLELYQRLSEITDLQQISLFVRELNDRFGPPPEEVDSLLFVVRIKALGSVAGIESISAENGDIVLRLFEGMRFDQNKLRALSRFGVTSTGSVGRFPKDKQSRGWKTALEEILSALSLPSQKTPGNEGI